MFRKPVPNHFRRYQSRTGDPLRQYFVRQVLNDEISLQFMCTNCSTTQMRQYQPKFKLFTLSLVFSTFVVFEEQSARHTVSLSSSGVIWMQSSSAVSWSTFDVFRGSDSKIVLRDDLLKLILSFCLKLVRQHVLKTSFFSTSWSPWTGLFFSTVSYSSAVRLISCSSLLLSEEPFPSRLSKPSSSKTGACVSSSASGTCIRSLRDEKIKINKQALRVDNQLTIREYCLGTIKNNKFESHFQITSSVHVISTHGLRKKVLR